MKKLTQKIPGVWKAKSGSLYPLLERMVKKGLVRVEFKRGKKKYLPTLRGREAIEQYLRVWRELYFLFKQMNR